MGMSDKKHLNYRQVEGSPVIHCGWLFKRRKRGLFLSKNAKLHVRLHPTHLVVCPSDRAADVALIEFELREWEAVPIIKDRRGPSVGLVHPRQRPVFFKAAN